MALKYLTELLIRWQSKVHNVRLDNDFYLLEPIVTNLRKSKAAFSVSAPLVWNELPFYLRCQTELTQLKVVLKTSMKHKIFQ